MQHKKAQVDKKIYFISGIDTDCGKTYITGLIAKYLFDCNINVTTQKLVQTGCTGIALDILEHRKIMGVELSKEDHDKTSCCYVFEYPASPHLAAKLENREIDIEKIRESSQKLLNKYDIVLLEGAGGLHVPINEDVEIIDYIENQNIPLILVSSSKLGSINHTLLSLEVCMNRKIHVDALIYNHFPNDSQQIIDDSKRIIKKKLTKYFKNAKFFEVRKNQTQINLDTLFGRVCS